MRHLKVGVTGGIGSGKSTICSIFEHLGVPVYNADNRAKWLMHHDKELREKLKEAFGWDTFDKQGNLDRTYLAKIVFNSPSKLKKLNSLVHPAVFIDYQKWVVANKEAGHKYSVKEAALLIEAGSYKDLDKLVVVTCPIDIRLERIAKRDNARKEDVLKRINNQISDKERLLKADYVVKNASGFSLIKQVLELHKEFLSLSAMDYASNSLHA
jgi:dephospho-CoA kinase